MRGEDPRQNSLDAELYARSQKQLLAFKSQLPAASVEGLAREVIRRLSEREAESSVEAPSENQIEHLCHALLSEDANAGAAFIQDARTVGASIEAVYLKYLAGAARMLGMWWDEDFVSFAEVTLGTSRMYAIMRALRYEIRVPTVAGPPTAIFASVPGETHTLGVRMAADLFRMDGWKIDLKIAESHDALVTSIVESETRLIGLSAGGAHSLQALSQLIIALRIRVPTARVFVSGQAIEEAASAIELIDVDGVADDIDTAKELMGSLWQTLHS